MSPAETSIPDRSGVTSPPVDLSGLPPHVWVQVHDRERIQRKLRISLTEHCNLACFFCHNEGQGQIARIGRQALSVSDVESVVHAATAEGVRKLKLTGGEPLLYRHGDDDVVSLVERLARIPGLDTLDLSLTTNGTLMPEFARKLREAGLNRVTLSITTLQEETFRSLISGNSGLLARSVAGLRAAREADLLPLKINMAVYHSMRSGLGNLRELRAVFDAALAHDVAELRLFTLIWHENFPRFTEFYQFFSIEMRRELELLLASCDVTAPRETVQTLADLALSFADRTYPKIEFGVLAGPVRLGFEAMKYGRLPLAEGFQEGPYAMRLGADGALRPTLHGAPRYDLIEAVRQGAGHADLRHLYRTALLEMP